MRDAYLAGRAVDFRAGGPLDESVRGDGWGEERSVRAEVVCALLLGDGPGPSARVPALRVAGARVTGVLDLDGADVRHGISFEGCWFEQPVRISGSAIRTLDFTASRVPGLDLAMTRADGKVLLRQAVVDGTLNVQRAHIVGELILNGAAVSTSDEESWAVLAGGLVMEGGLFCTGAVIDGGLRMPGAQLAGGLHMRRARLRNAEGTALLADHVVASGVWLSDGFSADGMVSLRGAQIADLLTLDGATLRAPVTALDCTRVQAGALVFTPAEPPSGRIDLRDAKVGVLHDRPDRWPPTVFLQGLTYGSLHESDDAQAPSLPSRLAWLELNPRYTAQPYEQLALWYRQIGHDNDARRVLLTKQRHRRRTLAPPSRLWGHLLDWTVGYGYRPWLAGLWLAVLTLVGFAVFSTHTPRATEADKVPPFNALVYTLDLLIPIGGFGQRVAWYWPPGTVAWFAYALIAAGWILTTAVVAGVTRTLNRN
ncbi:oxidoreductase [Streptomyces sp. NPDC004290]